MHTRPLTPLRNELNQFSFYLDDCYTSITSITHAPTHHYPNYSIQIFFFPFMESFFFSPASRKGSAYSYLVHPFTDTSMIAKPRLLRHLSYDVHINTTQTLPSRLRNPELSLFPTIHHIHHTHPYYTTYPPSTHYTQHT